MGWVPDDYDPCDKWVNETWTLDSDSLFYKYGFDDGDLFDDLCLDNELNMPDKKELLRDVVNAFLLPKLGVPVELYDANTVHNRVRADDSFKCLFEPVSVVVTGADIFRMLDAQAGHQ